MFDGSRSHQCHQGRLRSQIFDLPATPEKIKAALTANLKENKACAATMASR